MNSRKRNRERLRLIVPVMAAVFFCSLVAAQAAPHKEWKAPSRASRKKNPVAVDAASLELGKIVYTKECASCHGDTGVGDGPAAKNLEVHPGDLTKPSVAEQRDGALYWKITNGRAPMATFKKKLSDTERWQVTNYLRTLTAPAAK